MEQETQFIEKKQFSLSIMLLTGLMLALFIALFILFNNRIEKLNSMIESTTQVFVETPESEKENFLYMVKEFNGKIGVYLNGDFQYDVDINVVTLPEEDKQLLSKGIFATSEQELNEIISTYY